MGVLQTDEADEQADTDRDTDLQCRRDRVEDRFTDIGQGQDDENDTLCEDCGQSDLPGISHAQDNRVGHIGVQAHTCRQCERQVCQQCHQKACKTGRQSCGCEDSTLVHAGVTENARIDSQDVGHGHEGCNTRHDLGPDIRVPFLQFKKLFQNKYLLFMYLMMHPKLYNKKHVYHTTFK